jgi:hypothetical protein
MEKWIFDTSEIAIARGTRPLSLGIAGDFASGWPAICGIDGQQKDEDRLVNHDRIIRGGSFRRWKARFTIRSTLNCFVNCIS